MSLVRVQTIWTGVAGSPYYTNLYALGPLSNNNGSDMATAWRTFLQSLSGTLAAGLVATIDNEVLEFDETNGNVTGAGNTIQSPVSFTATGDQLPHSNQLLIRWSTNGIVHNRRVRGRTFLPGAVESQNSSGGAPLPILGTPVQSGLDAFLTTMWGRLRIWSQPHVATVEKPEPPTRPGSAWAVQGVTIAPFWAVLRSRRD
jgi:hypothetical protein